MQSVSVQIVGFGVEILAHLYVLKQRHSDVPDRAYARSSQKMYEHVISRKTTFSCVLMR